MCAYVIVSVHIPFIGGLFERIRPVRSGRLHIRHPNVKLNSHIIAGHHCSTAAAAPPPPPPHIKTRRENKHARVTDPAARFSNSIYHSLEFVVSHRNRKTNVKRNPHRRRHHVHLVRLMVVTSSAVSCWCGDQLGDFRPPELCKVAEYRGDFLGGGGVQQRSVARWCPVSGCAELLCECSVRVSTHSSAVLGQAK